MKTSFKFFILAFVFATTLTSCEDVIDFETREGVQQLVVDAWLTDTESRHVVKLTLSQPYFDNSAPIPALGATVIVFSQDSTAYQFTDEAGNGEYVYESPTGESLIKNVGESYALYVNYEGEEYVSLAQLNPVPKIDSIAYEAFTAPINLNDTLPSSGFIAQFYATDFLGRGNAYWIRYRKNGKLNNDPSDLILSYDGGFTPGADTDGLQFILPIRQSINEFGEGLYQDKDSLEVEIYSLSLEAYFFLFQVVQESSN
ncbi:MAG: DUF4249 domain-containing protein, partial [Spirosomaceae bacterium]|nr:DUF4249 domain-containing protein [Spirosomataceae bacterium]